MDFTNIGDNRLVRFGENSPRGGRSEYFFPPSYDTLNNADYVKIRLRPRTFLEPIAGRPDGGIRTIIPVEVNR